jgi:two-component sensor histidine kinase
MNCRRSFVEEAVSVPGARRFVLGCVGHLAPPVLENVGLMVSELATNAVLYGATGFDVEVRCSDDDVVVAVRDGGKGIPYLGPLPSQLELHGRGLRIVGELADAWGVDIHGDRPGKTVWFRLRLQPASGSVARRGRVAR